MLIRTKKYRISRSGGRRAVPVSMAIAASPSIRVPLGSSTVGERLLTRSPNMFRVPRGKSEEALISAHLETPRETRSKLERLQTRRGEEVLRQHPVFGCDL